MWSEGALRGGPHEAVVFALISVLHLRAENVAFKRLRCLVRLMPGYVLLADGIELLFLQRGASGTSPWQAALPFTLEPRLVELSALMRLGARLRVH